MFDFEQRPQHALFLNSPVNVSAGISFGEGKIYEYRRTSVKKDETDPYHHDLSRPYTDNTIFARGVSAFNREDIFEIIRFLIENGSRNFIFRVIDETRFTRNINTALKIYDLLLANKTTFLIEINGKRYDYVKEYYNSLRSLFVASESSSLEKSRISKMTHAKRRTTMKARKEIKENFIDMLFVIGKDIEEVKNTIYNTGIKGLNDKKLQKWSKTRQKKIQLLRKKKKYAYAKCHTTGDYFIVPNKYALRDDISFGNLGFGGKEIMKKFFTTEKNLNYLCSPKEEFSDKDSVAPVDMDMAGPAAGPAAGSTTGDEKLSSDEKKWLIDVYIRQHIEGQIAIEELTEKMTKLFTP